VFNDSGIANTSSAFQFDKTSNIVTINGSFIANGTSTVQQIKEKVQSNATGSTGTVNFDILSGAIFRKSTAATSNFTINIRGNSTVTLDSILSNNESITCTYLNQTGSPGYIANVIQIDGTTQTINYVTSYSTLPTINGIDAYTFNIIKVNPNSYVVLGSKVGYD